MKRLFLIALLLVSLGSFAQLNINYESGYSLNHEECIAAFQQLKDNYLKCDFREIGPSDCGRPIHLFTAGTMSEQLPTVLINNAIHPGESCGVEASLLLIEELLKSDSPILDKINIAVIPMYNVGGALNRGCCTRANQDGPTEQGFRGNGQNLDLNRDFVKADSKNARTFQSIFQELKPHIFVDTHTSNGADYPYTMTLIHSQLDMIDEHLAKSYKNTLIPFLYEHMEERFPMVPYMNLIGSTPEEGIMDFPDWPRYSTGYASLFNTFGFTTEAHMLKPFRDRVLATYDFLNGLTRFTAENASSIVKNKLRADRNTLRLDSLFLDFKVDTLEVDSILFRGFKAVYEKSKVTGLDRLRYDRNELWQKKIPYMKNYQGKDKVGIPEFYFISQAWSGVIERLQINGVEMEELENDTMFMLEAYRIVDMETSKEPYEGHYVHSQVKTEVRLEQVQLLKGDYRIPTEQFAKRYIVNALEPRAKDSFFAWGFFDAVLQQKEWFSPYVFEDEAEQILNNDPKLKKEFEEKKKDRDFADSMWAQLIFIYRHSDYYEKTHSRYPVFKSVP